MAWPRVSVGPKHRIRGMSEILEERKWLRDNWKELSSPTDKPLRDEAWKENFREEGRAKERERAYKEQESAYKNAKSEEERMAAEKKLFSRHIDQMDSDFKREVGQNKEQRESRQVLDLRPGETKSI